MFEVYFKNSSGNLRLIKEANNKEEIKNIIQDFLDEHNFKSYYWRMWYESEESYTYVDVGSHSEFFCIREIKVKEK